MTTTRPELTGVAGVPESAVSAALLASLPDQASPAPWSVTCEAVLWWCRPSAAATRALPPALRSGHRALVVVGAMVRYLDSPVGPYDEVLGLVACREGVGGFGTVCFMAVDSPASLVGGRANWGMPKTLGRFSGSPAAGSTFAAQGADEVRWEVSARARAVGPPLPARSNAVCRQQTGPGRLADSRLSARARVRPALVDVAVASPGDLASWLRPGRHLGGVVQRSTFSLAAPSSPTP